MRAAVGLLNLGVVLEVGVCSDGEQDAADSGLSMEEGAARRNYASTVERTPVFELVSAFNMTQRDLEDI